MTDVERQEIRAAVREKVLSREGIDALEFMDHGFRQEVEGREREAESYGAVGGLMAFVNTGVWDVFPAARSSS